jgi:hypothetical protein
MPIPPAAKSVTHPPRWTDDMKKEPRISLGLLPLARRDIERLRQILGLQRRLTDSEAGAARPRALMHKGTFREALTGWRFTARRRRRGRVARVRGARRAQPGEPVRGEGKASARAGAAGAAGGGVRRPRIRRRRGRLTTAYPFVRSNSRMNCTSASTPSSGNAL